MSSVPPHRTGRKSSFCHTYHHVLDAPKPPPPPPITPPVLAPEDPPPILHSSEEEREERWRRTIYMLDRRQDNEEFLDSWCTQAHLKHLRQMH